ncbi:MAG: 1-acyl-sn-glycerol-3-phosphate acyltransferase [Candidatus Hydrogenedentes bacterium]|nr:1-acyl-sn-glycerol-3-phosphate acyltransferase [Candidatus Hydrogenedentota bacterium]
MKLLIKRKRLYPKGSKLRAIFRLTLLFFIFAPILFAIKWVISLFVSERLDRNIRRVLLHRWAKLFVFFCGIKIEIVGNPPKLPCFIVANHISYVDTLVLHYATKCIFVSRGDVEHWPLIGVIAKAIYIIFIDRSNRLDTKRVNEEIKHALTMGDGVAVFAESRISCGKDVQPFRSALLSAPIELNLPVYYATITYETLPGYNTPPVSYFVAWWRPEPFFYHLFRLLSYKGFKSRVIFGDKPLYESDRKQLAQKLWEKVKENFTPVS